MQFLMNKLLLFIVGILFFSCNAQAQVSVNTDMTNTISVATEKHYGINVQRPFDPAIAADPNFKARLGEINPGIIRYHASEQIKEGNLKSWIDFPNKKWNASVINTVLSEAEPNTELLITITGWPLWMAEAADGKRLHPDSLQAYAEFCAELVDIVNNQYGFNVQYWEPFNEKDKEGGYSGNVDMQILASIHQTCRTAMLAVDPSIKIVAGAFREPYQSNINHFLSYLNPGDFDIFSYHQYGGTEEADTTVVYNRADNFANGASSLRSKLDNNGFAGVPIWLDEWNIYSSYLQDLNLRFMRSEIGGVFDALSYKYTLEQGLVDATFSWNAADGTYGKIKSDYTGLNPAGNVLKLFRQYGVGNIKSVFSTNNLDVEGYSVEGADGKTMFALINRSQSAINVNFSASGWEPTIQDVLKYTINKVGLLSETVQWSAITQSAVPMGTDEVIIFATQSDGSIVNQFPFVKAPANRILSKPYSEISLTGAASDADGSISSVSWTQLTGPSATISGANTLNLNLSNLQPDREYQFQLEVIDNEGGRSSDFVSVFTYGFLPNALINKTSVYHNFFGAEAGNSAFEVRKDTRASYSQNGELTISLNSFRQFEKMFRLIFNNQAALDLSGNATVAFDMSSTAPVTIRVKLIDLNGQSIDLPAYEINLTGGQPSQTYNLDFAADLANIDATSVSEIQLMQISTATTTGTLVLDNFKVGDIDLATLLIPPVIELGPKRIFTSPVSEIRLSGFTGDSDGIVTDYNWQKISGPAVSTSGSDTEELILSNPAAGIYTFELTLTDDDGLQSSDQKTVEVVDNTGSFTAGAEFLSTDYAGTVIGDVVQSTGSNFILNRSQNDGLTLDFSGMDQYKKPYLITLNNGYTVDVSQNSELTFTVQSTIEVRMRAKLIDINGGKIDRSNYDFTVPGDNSLKTISFDYSQHLGDLDPEQVQTIEFMSVSPTSLSGQLTFKQFTLGNSGVIINVTDISLQPSSLNLVVGESSSLIASVSPANASDQGISYSSSNAAIASVDNSGLVTANQTGQVTITAATNDGGFTAASTITVLPAPPSGEGVITREYWIGNNGKSISNLTSNVNYPDSPTGADQLTSLEAVNWNNITDNNTWADNYGQRIRGYVTAPYTGDYTFWIAGDDSGELYLSSNSNPNNSVLIASHATWSGFREWNKFPSQTSGVISLVEGQKYYVEVLHKEGSGGDHLSVGWSKPGQSTAVPTEVIPGSALSPFTEATGFISRAYWTGISGKAIGDLTNNVNYPNNPTAADELSSFQAVNWNNASQTSNWADEYGQRIRGYIYPTVTGNYTFWVSADDRSALYISSDDNPVNATLIASSNDWTGQLEWTKYASQKSTTIALVAGQKYYIEALHKERSGGDHLAVGWSKPGESTATASEVVPGSVLSPFIATGTTSSRSLAQNVKSTSAAIEDEFTTSVLMMYPNPIKKGQTLQLSANYEDALQITLLDVAGRVVLTAQMLTNEVKVLSLPLSIRTGIYMLRLESENNVKIGRLIVKD